MKIENELATIPSGGAFTAWGVTKSSNSAQPIRKMEKAHKNKLWRTLYSCRLATLGRANTGILLGDDPFWKERCYTRQDSSSQGSPFLTDCQQIPRRINQGKICGSSVIHESEAQDISSQWLQSIQPRLSLLWLPLPKWCLSSNQTSPGIQNHPGPRFPEHGDGLLSLCPLSGQWCLLQTMLPMVVAG